MAAIINKDAESKPSETNGVFAHTGLDKRYFVRRATAIQREMSQWTSTWRDLKTYVYPTRGVFDTGTPNSGVKIDHTKLLDGEAMLDADIFKAGMMSSYTSRARPWFKLGLFDPDITKWTPVKIWLDTCTDILHTLFQRSNVYDMFGHIYGEIVVFGTGCATLMEDFFRIVRAEMFTCGEYSLAVNDQGKVDTFHRRYWMTTANMIKRFGRENVSTRIQDKYSIQPDSWNIVNHLVEPNNDRVPFLKNYRNMKYRSLYWEDGGENDEAFLRVGGYEEFPFLAPRLDRTTSYDVYGKGPGWKALGDIKGLQQLVRNKFIGLDKQTDPPVQADASVVGDVNTLPGGVTRTSAQLPNTGVRTTYEVQLNLADLEMTIEKTKIAIGRYFFTDLFRMFLEADRQNRQVTATEIIEKQSERLAQLGPIMDTFEEELCTPTIERGFMIASRLGMFPPSPPEIQDMELRIQYISVLAQAQKMVNITGINQWVAETVQLSQVDPSIVDNINFDELAITKADMLGVPAKVMRSPEEKIALRKGREQQAAQQAAQQGALSMAEAAAKGGKAVESLSKSKMGENNALDATLATLKGVQRQ